MGMPTSVSKLPTLGTRVSRCGWCRYGRCIAMIVWIVRIWMCAQFVWKRLAITKMDFLLEQNVDTTSILLALRPGFVSTARVPHVVLSFSMFPADERCCMKLVTCRQF